MVLSKQYVVLFFGRPQRNIAIFIFILYNIHSTLRGVVSNETVCFPVSVL